MVTTETSINCLIDAGVIDQEQGGEMLQVITSLPSDVSSLLQILIALNLTQEP